ncbi:MAG: GPI inositol-deacylase [Bacteroidales bacterium]|jgi:pimeloyl-ACP methyl ester carboxylesterase|nr:GPI inositol-deacylase [Bacteroidales bacterium]
MKKINCLLVILVFTILNMNAQRPPFVDTCVYREIYIPSDWHSKTARLDYPIVWGNGDNGNAAYRGIYFIHGLGGDASAWNKVQQACMDKSLNIQGFPARKCYAYTPDYNNHTQGTLYLAAKEVLNDIRIQTNVLPESVDPNQSILIAHSQGGLVARTMMHLNFVQESNEVPSKGRGYGGVVFVSTPLQGAMILNNRQKMLDMANDACKSLIQGPTSTTPLMRTVLRKLGGKTVRDDVCNLVTEDVLPLFFADYYAPVTSDYLVGAEYINTLNEDQNNMDYCQLPKIVFYGVEPVNNIFWRTANWLVKSPNDAGFFEANDDYDFYNNTVYPQYVYYDAQYQSYEKKYQQASKAMKWTWWTGVGAIASEIAMESYAKQIARWSMGKYWFERVNGQWEVVIGAREYIKGSSQWTRKENDGIIITESAINLPCATSQRVRVFPNENNPNAAYRGSSHMQIRNDEGIKYHLNSLFNGDYGIFFKTSTK